MFDLKKYRCLTDIRKIGNKDQEVDLHPNQAKYLLLQGRLQEVKETSSKKTAAKAD